MILKACLQLIFIKIVASQIGEQCLSTKIDEYPSYMEHPLNCSRFLECDNGIWREMECPARLQWNQEHNVCDWPSSAHCKLNHMSNFQIIDTQPFVAGVECSQSIERNHPIVTHHSNDCRKFLICNRKWIEMECPRELLFSVDTNHCEYPKNAKCCENCEVSKKECEIDGSRLVHPDDCQSYYECQDGKLTEIKCGENEHYDPLKGICIIGACDSFEVNPIPFAALDLPDCPLDGILYPNYLNCKKFFICNGGTLVEQSCPPHKFFSIAHGDCEVESEAICAGVDNFQETAV